MSASRLLGEHPPVSAHRRSGPLRLATHAMGTRFEIVLADARSTSLRAAGESAIDEIERCHRQLTRFAPDSLLSHIHRVAWQRPVRLDADTFALFEEALAVHQASGGSFDIAVGDTMDALLGRAVRSERDTALNSDGAQPAFTLDPVSRTIRLRDARVSLDLGAIAKGHALDLAASVLRGNSVDCALLHGGTSSVIALGAPPDSDGWRIRLAPNATAPTVTLRDRALSVSCAAGPWDATRGRGSPHLVDGRSHRSVVENQGVAVVGPSARGADAWSTAIAVLGERPTSLDPVWEAHFFAPSAEVG